MINPRQVKLYWLDHTHPIPSAPSFMVPAHFSCQKNSGEAWSVIIESLALPEESDFFAKATMRLFIEEMSETLLYTGSEFELWSSKLLAVGYVL